MSEDRDNLGPPPPVFRFPDQAGAGPRRRGGGNWWVYVVGFILAVLLLVGGAKELYIDYLWFQSVGYTHIFQITLGARLALFAGGAAGVFVFLAGNLLLARSLAPRPALTVEGTDLSLAGRMMTLLIIGASLLLAFIFGASLSNEWQRIFTALDATPFGQTDPVFGEEVSFYIFALPMQQLLQKWALGVVIATLIGVLILYALALTFGGRLAPRRTIKAHVSLLGAVVLALLAVQYWLSRYDLLLDPSGVVFGPGYTDVAVKLQVRTLLALVTAVTSALLVLNISLRGVLLPAVGVATMAGVLVLGGGYAELVQRLQVKPNELSRERPYIENNIKFTRTAFGLDRIEEVAHPGNTEPSLQELIDNPETIRNIRLWDHAPLKDTYEQIQAIRRYYSFNDVDIDRYTIDNQYRQVMLSARELDPDKLSLAGEALTWVNEHLKFTHGYGVALSPVNEIADNRLPNLFVRDLPPVVTKNNASVLNIERPEIYFGEKSTQWVIANTQEPEIDFASGAETKFTSYQGKGGVLLDSVWMRALFAWHFGDPNILLTDVKPDSRILFNRQIQERVRHIVPFLRLDRDPYLVISNGRLVYVQDAYTTSSRFPYSQLYPMVDQQRGRTSINYIRNSVKAVVDAYDGTVDFYISDPSDPLIQTYAKLFPNTFKAMDQMPAGLRQHLRYPEDLFNLQSNVYENYHMQDPQIFYNKEDAYSRPQEIYLDKPQLMEPYYVIMRLPGQSQPEFMLILPFTPAGKNNANAWLAGRADGDHYGKLLAFKFPNDKLIFGPRQIESRIDQDGTIADQFGKWKNSGSTVIRGNLLFVPVGDSYIYVEPIYLQSQQSRLPELTRVVVAAGERIEMETSLEESLNKVFRTQVFRQRDGVVTTPAPAPGAPAATPPSQPPPGTPSTTVPPAGTPASSPLTALARQAQEQFTRAQDRLRTGDWAGYGEAQKQLEDTLKQMAVLAGPDTTRRTP